MKIKRTKGGIVVVGGYAHGKRYARVLVTRNGNVFGVTHNGRRDWIGVSK